MNKMQKLKNYLKRNYKVLLGILLTISAYIGLMFLNRYLEKYCKEELATCQPIISTRGNNRKRANTDNGWSTEGERNLIYDISGAGERYSFDIDRVYISNDAFDLYDFYVDDVVLEYSDYSYTMTYYEFESMNIDNIPTYVDIILDYDFGDMQIIEPNKYYYFYNYFSLTSGNLGEYRLSYTLGTLSDTPILKGSSILANNTWDLRYIITLDLISGYEVGNTYDGMLYHYFGLYDLTDFLNNAYSNNEIYNNGYQNGYNNGYDYGYSEGYTEGINNSVDSLLNFNNTSINSLYQTDVGSYGVLDTYYFPINGYTYNFTSDVETAKEDRIVAEDYSDSGNMIIDIYNISDFSIKILEFETVGFNKIEFLNNSNIVQSINIDDYRTLNKISFETNNLSDEIKLYYNALEDVQAGYILNIYNKNDYQNGYQNGYNTGKNEGIIIGKNDVINNPNDYDLYTENQYIAYGNSQFSIGNSQACKLNNVFFSIADVPFIVLSSLLGFELFGFSLFNALTSIITVLVIVWLAKKLM